jgi:hypothetical protein
MFKSLPFEPRQIKATEARLQAIYDAAALGLKGDSLALAAGMLPSEYRQLCQLDPLAAMAEAKGRADSESEAANQLRLAARNGVAKQQVQVDIQQQISITAALQEANTRVIEGRVLSDTPAALAHQPTTHAPTRAAPALTAEYATTDL